MSTLEEAWTAHGFIRIHRGYLVALRRVEELRTEIGRGFLVRVHGVELPVSRRHARDFRDRLLQLANDRA